MGGLADLRGPQLGHLVGEQGLDAVVQLAGLGGAGAVVSQLLGRQVPGLLGGAGQDGITRGAYRGALLA